MWAFELVYTKIIVHPTCYSSYRLIKHFMNKPLLERLEFIVAEHASVALKHRVWSVPWLLINGTPVAADPIEPEEVEAIIQGQNLGLSKGIVESFTDAIIHSVFASSQLALWRSIDPLIDRDFVSAATRAVVTGIDVDQAMMELREKSQEILQGVLDKVTRALAVSFTREVWWTHGGELTSDYLLSIATPGSVATWLIAKASIGRIGLPGKPMGVAMQTAREISDFISRSAKGIISKIEREQREILEDGEYWAVLRRLRHE